jgi:glutamate-ammonia-ligase adenylyltransferase
MAHKLSKSPWPLPADPAAAERLAERFAARSDAAAALAATADGSALLSAIGGGSPFLSDLAIREHAIVEDFAAQGPDATLARSMAALAAISPAAPRAQVAAAMRRAKRQVALVTALADIGGQWGLARVTGAISELAEAALRLAIAHLVLAAHHSGALTLPDPSNPEQGCGLVVLGMGKLGARELNYSSDIDLILLFDPDAHAQDSLGATFTRIARALVGMMEARDADGYVFRTDLRLRPDPAATPPAVALPGAITYYETMGQNWERAAMTKARPVAGDIACGHAFLSAIRPFVWRRRLDFAAIADLHAMKRRIDAHMGFAPGDPVMGHDVKLGPGGIREIEFAAQTLQLVWGGRDPALRAMTTLGALRGLVRAGHLTRRAAAELTVAYRLLRRIEHRLQMVADRQTHIMPEKPEELRRFAIFLGCHDETALAALMARHMAHVRARYAEVFETVPAPQSAEAPLDLTGRDLPEATVQRLASMGFHNGPGMIATLRGWRAGRLRALRTPRARELMDEVLPSLLAALASQPDPDAAFNRFDAMLSRQPAGVELLSMLHRNPAMLARVAAVLGAAPILADHLASVPTALEGLLAPPRALEQPRSELLANRLRDAHSLEDVLSITRNLVRADEFRLCVAQMQGAIDVDQAGFARTALTDAALAALLPAVLADHARRYGHVRGGDMAVVALGKAGSREMMAGSDLDLLLLYTYPPRIQESGGPKRLPVSQYFIRAAHAFVAALTAPGSDGHLYDVDVRLRPSGNKGPVAVPLDGFVRYHQAEAWTWERMALTRARVVAGNPAIKSRAERAIAAALATPVDPAATRADAAAMRMRLLRDLPPTGPWDVKLRPGGGMEVEFIAQVLQLTHQVRPVRQTTAVALRHLQAIGALTSAETNVLVRADRLWRTVQSILRISVGRATGAPPAAAYGALLQATSAIAGTALDESSLDATLQQAALDVRAIFNHRIGAIE